MIGNVLQRDIDVVTDLRFLSHYFNQLIGDLVLIAVHEADPVYAVDLHQFLQKWLLQLSFPQFPPSQWFPSALESSYMMPEVCFSSHRMPNL